LPTYRVFTFTESVEHVTLITHYVKSSIIVIIYVCMQSAGSFSLKWSWSYSDHDCMFSLCIIHIYIIEKKQ